MQLAKELEGALSALNGPTLSFLDAYWGPGYEGHALRQNQKMRAILLQFGSELELAARRPKRRQGSQRRLPDDGTSSPSEVFAWLACRAVRAVGGRLTVYKDTGEGTFPKFLDVLKPSLPPQCVEGLSPVTLARIKKAVDRE